MAIKSWEAVDVDIDRVIRLWLDDDNQLHVLRGYDYVGAEGDVIPVGQKEHEEVVAWDVLPTEIKSALTTINDYINTKIREKEGLL